MELSNSLWLSVEPWAAVQQRRLVVLRLAVQGEGQLRSALQLLQVVQLEFRLRVDLGLRIFPFCLILLQFKGYWELPAATMSSYSEKHVFTSRRDL